jgi:anaerobic selenocysteine-containing dehydrogenase
MIHPDDAVSHGVSQGDLVRLGNHRGDVVLEARIVDGMQPGVLIAEGLFPNAMHRQGEGINVLTSADQVAPHGGAAFHDVHVWLSRT